MPKQVISIRPVGNIDRRNLVTEGNEHDVLSRENLYVVGTSDYKTRKVKKLPGASRFNATGVGTTFKSGIRYYTKKDVRRTFAYNTDGYIYYFDENGNTTQLLGLFSSLARPCWQVMRVSDADILYFSEGIDSEMYSFNGNLDNVFIRENSVTLNAVDLASWLDRMWAIEEDEEIVNFSKNLVPTDFTDSTDAGAIVVGAREGSKNQRIIVYQDILYIFKNDSIWRILGRTPNEFVVEVVEDSIGLGARWSLQKTEGGFIFLGSDYEFYAFGGSKGSLKKLTHNVAMAGDLTTSLNPIINKNKMIEIESTYHNNLYRCSFVESGQVNPNMEYIFNTINETDSFSRGFNISCYIKFDRHPDVNQLFTGRFGDGRLMRMYDGYNVDSGATSPEMSFKTQTKFIGDDSPINMRVKKVWCHFGVTGSAPARIKMYKDARTASSDSTTDELVPFGESKNSFGINIASQSAVTPRFVPRWGNSKCNNFSLEINDTREDFDLEFSQFFVQIVAPKNLKRSKPVGV